MTANIQKPIIFCLGAPGSGLNLLSQCLRILGLTSLDHKNHTNVAIINALLFQDLGLSPLMAGPLPADWLNSDSATRARERIHKLLSSNESSNQPFFLADPLLCRVLPLWLEASRAYNIEHKSIHILRHPWEVAQSLAADENIELSKAPLNWFACIRDIMCYCPIHNLITFDQLLADPINTLRTASAKLNFFDTSRISLHGSLLEYVQPNLKHYHAEDFPDQEKHTYKAFERLYQELRLSQYSETQTPSAEINFNKSLLPRETHEIPAKQTFPGENPSSSESDLIATLLHVIGQYEAKEHDLNPQEERLSSPTRVESSGQVVPDIGTQLHTQNKNLLSTLKNQRDEAVKLQKNLKDFVKKETRNAVKQIEAFLGVQHYLKTGKLIGEFHGWPISPDFALYLIELIETNKYDLVIEFGSGTSTVLIAQALAEKASQIENEHRIRQVAYEHLEHYYNQTLSYLKQAKLEGSVDLVLAPLESYHAPDGEKYSYYSCRKILARILDQSMGEPIRILVVVDGPPTTTGKHARYPALPIILKLFTGSKIDFLLDDYGREDEMQVVKKWTAEIESRKLQYLVKEIKLEKKACLLSVIVTT